MLGTNSKHLKHSIIIWLGRNNAIFKRIFNHPTFILRNYVDSLADRFQKKANTRPHANKEDDNSTIQKWTARTMGHVKVN